MGTSVLIAIGDELLSGIRSEKNCSWLAARFHDAGWQVKAIEVVEDSEEAICNVLDKWIGSVDIIVTSGGLGPTHDDRTRQAIASYLGCGLIMDKDKYAIILSRYHGDLKTVIERSAVPQGLIPSLAESIYNPVGSALGIGFHKEETAVFSFPGVPGEYKAMARVELASILERKGYWKSIHVVGWAESVLKDRIAEIILSPNLHVSILPSPNLIEIVLNGIPEAVDRAFDSIHDLLPHDCLPEYAGNIEEAVMKAAMDSGCTFSCAESCTGGLIGAALTSLPGISRVFAGSAVCYSNVSKMRILGVDPDIIDRFGAVSAECAAAMATGSRKIYDSDYSVSVTGIAGPDGGTPEKPVGTVWFGISSAKGEKTINHEFSGDRQAVRRRTVAVALELLWREIYSCPLKE